VSRSRNPSVLTRDAASGSFSAAMLASRVSARRALRRLRNAAARLRFDGSDVRRVDAPFAMTSLRKFAARMAGRLSFRLPDIGGIDDAVAVHVAQKRGELHGDRPERPCAIVDVG
jgi:hypothetical protein